MLTLAGWIPTIFLSERGLIHAVQAPHFIQCLH